MDNGRRWGSGFTVMCDGTPHVTQELGVPMTTG